MQPNHRTRRLALRAKVVRRLRPAIARLVRPLPGHWRETAEQVGAFGVLVALERFDPTAGVPFRRAALAEARVELLRWLQTATPAN
jgi:hypothetical protein